MFKELLKRVRDYKTATILSMVFIIFEVLMECSIPFLMSALINSVSEMKSEAIYTYSGILVLLAFAALAFGILSGRYAALASAGFAKNLRNDLYEHISTFSFANIDKFSSSSLVTRLTTDVSNVQMAFMMIIRSAIRSPLMLIFSITMSFIMAPSLAWIFLAIVPVLFIALLIIIKLAMPRFRAVFKKYDNVNNSVQENVSGIRTVKSFVREDYETEKFKTAAGDLKKDFTIAERIVAFNQPVMQFSIYSMNILVIFLGASIIAKTGGVDLDVGNLSSLLVYGIQTLMALMMLSMIIVMLTMAIESGNRIVEVLNEKSSLTNPEEPIYEVPNGDIQFKNVSFKYKEEATNYALKDVNLKIESGQTIGVIGGTGSSKSTLVNLISRLYDVSDGEVLVGDHDVKEYDIESLRNQVSVVLQKNLLFSGTIKENLLWGDENATDEEIKAACKAACADEFIESFPDKYETHIEQGGTNVSGGQKQRLCIARALLKKPKVLILDDSTSAVDTKTDAKIRKALKNIIPETTKIIIAQRIASISECDQIIVMDNGSINEIGKHQDLLDHNTIYQEVYYSQNKVSGKEAS